MPLRNLLWLSVTALVLAACVNENNPFQSYSNAYCVLTGAPFENATGTPLYATKTLTLTVGVLELVDSIGIHVENNRFWTDTTIKSLKQHQHLFSVSFYDTGMQQIRITTFRDNGTSQLLLDSIYVSSPLNQADTTIDVDEPVILLQQAVKDDNVWYHWSYGTVVTEYKHSRRNDILATFRYAAKLQARIWVSEDSLGKRYASPAATCSIRVVDILGPRIRLGNLRSGDTIVTGDNPYVLEAVILDASGINRATINGKNFDAVSQPTYWEIFDSTQKFQSYPLLIAIAATDPSGTQSRDTFYLRYDQSIAPSPNTQIVVSNLRDTVRAGNYLLFGNLRNNSERKVGISASVNGLPPASIEPVYLSNGYGSWALMISLQAGTNHVTLTATDSLIMPLATKEFTIVRDPEKRDTTAPQIILAQVNGRNLVVNNQVMAGTTIVTDSVAVLNVMIFDESDIDVLTVNGHALSTGKGLQYIDTLRVHHRDSLSVVIDALDKAGNRQTRFFKLVQNRVPDIQAVSNWPRVMVVGVESRTQLAIRDDDPTIIKLRDNPKGMYLVNDTIVFKPQISDTGDHDVAVDLTDGLQDTTFNWHFTVAKDTTYRVRFVEDKIVLPKYLEATDSLNTVLEVATGTGKPPLHYVVFFTNTKDTLLDTIVSDTSGNPESIRKLALNLSTHASDTGIRNMAVSVTDSYGETDWLYHDIEIVPVNNDPCSLSVKLPDGIKTNSTGAIDLRSVDSTVTITFQINDSDHPFTEEHDLTVSSPGVVSYGKDSLSLSIALDPRGGTRSSDTIRIVVSDRTGANDSIIIPLIYSQTLTHNQIEGLFMWLDPKNGLLRDGNKQVTQWVDLVNGSLFSANAGGQPFIVDSMINGNPAVRFASGSSSGMWAAVSNLSSLWSGNERFTIFCVARVDTLVSGENSYYTLCSPITDPAFSFGVSGNGNIGAYRASATKEFFENSAKVVVNKWFIVSYTLENNMPVPNSVTMRTWLNGASTGNASVITNMVKPQSYFVLGAANKHYSVNPWVGAIGEVIISKSGLNEPTREDVESYLSKKYNIKLTP